MLLAHNISMSLATVIRVCEFSLNQFCPSLFCKFFCTLGATTYINELKYKRLGQFSKSPGRCSSHFASNIVGQLFFISKGLEGFTEPSKPSLEHHWSCNKYFQQQYRIYFLIVDIDFSFKYFLEIVCTKITL